MNKQKKPKSYKEKIEKLEDEKSRKKQENRAKSYKEKIEKLTRKKPKSNMEKI